jgi:3-oxoacyl-[acyl-carrier-protein] synthase-1
MKPHLIAIEGAGLVTPVGLSAPASCAAFRSKIANPVQTRFMDSDGEWIVGHQVPLEQPWRGLPKLAKMAAMAIDEALQHIPRQAWSSLPLLLCVAEAERPGRMRGLDDLLFEQIQDELGARFGPRSAVIKEGRAGVAVALAQARALLLSDGVPRVLIAATDSLLFWPTLSHYDLQDRLLTATNPNGFIPGEGAGALLLAPARGSDGELVCSGLGFGREAASVEADEPLRGDGLSLAINAALHEAGCELHDIDFRITDVSGEQYYFKEATLALSRILRKRKAEFDIWHPAECTGEQGANAGFAAIALALAACRKAFAPGPNILAHVGNDGGQRAAVVLQFSGGSR